MTQPAPPNDTGTQPTPHYCAHPVDALAATGCPRWPACATLDVRPAIEPDVEPDEDDIPGIAVLLVTLLGYVAAAVLVVVAVAALTWYMVFR